MQSPNGVPVDRISRLRAQIVTGLRAITVGSPLLLSAVLTTGAAPPANLQEALQAQRSLVDQNPSDAAQLNDLGNLLALAMDMEGAEDAYRRALVIEPGSTTTLYNLALVLQEQDEGKEARQTLISLLEINPDHAWGHYQLGTLYANRNNRSKALDHYERAFALDRTLVDPKVNPHIVENRLVTEALLEVYVSQSPSTQAPRLYREPGNVADLLLPAETRADYAADANEAGPAPDAETGTGQYRATFQPRTGVSQGWESSAANEDLQDDLQDSPDDETGGWSSSGGNPGPADTGYEVGSAPGWAGSPGIQPTGENAGSTFGQESGSAGVAAQPPVSTPPPVRRITSEDLRSSGDPVEQTTPFAPGIESTGRLDIELLPAKDSSSTVPAS